MDKLDSLLSTLDIAPDVEKFIKNYVSQNPDSTQLVEDIIQLDQGITAINLVKALKSAELNKE